MATRTATNKNRSQGNYITPDTSAGRKILNYLKDRCEKALDYCLDNGLGSIEDFADAVEELTEVDGKPSITVEIKHNGIVLSLSDRPEYGSTTGKYLMEHLGKPEDTRFTKTGIEAILNPEKTKSNSQKDDFLNDLEDDDLQFKSKTNTKTRKNELEDLDDEPFAKPKTKGKSQKDEPDELDLETPQPKSKTNRQSQTDDLDDLLDELDENESQPKPKSKARSKPQRNELEEEEPSSNSKTKRKSLQNPLSEEAQFPKTNPHKQSNNLDIDSILDATSQVSSRAATSGNEVDGTTIGGLSTQTAVLATLIGKKATSQVLEAAKAAGKERQIANIIKRLKTQSQRADSLTSRVKNLTQEDSDESETTSNESILNDEPESEPEPKSDEESLPKTGTLLAEAVNKVSQQVNKISTELDEDSLEKNTPIEIDTKASFDKQLAQINKALDRLEQRLDALSARIEALENKLSLSKTETDDQIIDEDAVTSESEKVASKPINTNSTDEKKAMSSPVTKTQESQIAPLLAQVYNLAEEEAMAAGETLEDGIELGATKLYLIRDRNSTTVSLENQQGEELFSATCSNNQWKVTNDFLTKEDKQEINRLDILQRTIHQECLAEMLVKNGLPQMNFTDSQGRRLNFEVEFSNKSKPSASIQGFNEYDEVVFDATVTRDKVEILQCDISAEEVKNLLQKQQQTPTTDRQKEQKTEAEMEI